MARLSEDERNGLLSAGTRISFGRGDVLLRQGESGATLFVLLAGYVKVAQAAGQGPETILALRGRGDLVGEFAVIDSRPRTASVTALGALATVRISRTRFLEFCERHPAANRKIMQILTDKIRRASDRRTAAHALDSRARLASLLYEVAAEHGVARADGTVIMPPLTQADLGALAAVAGSTVERVLKEFRADGIVLNRYRRTVVLDMEALRARAAGPS
ncbi:MAG TPA: Crp/Fnr family transcriptional regulator [Streptosporangiaceae bacterium]|nr:Crp/Fnr family transcriptional regulator [Streptosporangiaceae bacterium]